MPLHRLAAVEDERFQTGGSVSGVLVTGRVQD